MSPRKRDDVVTQEPEQASEGAAVTRNSLTVKLTAAGGIDFDAMRPSTRSKLQSALGMTGGMIGKSETQASVKINREFIPHIYDSLASGVQLAGRMFMKWPTDLTQFMVFTVEEKEKLTEPTAAVIEKHIPTKWLKYQEEAALVQALVNCTQAMVVRAVTQFAELKQAEEARKTVAAEGRAAIPFSHKPAEIPNTEFMGAGYIPPTDFVAGQGVTA